VVEVLTGDTLLLLPSGHEYDDESKLIKISLASIRAPRVGNERMGRPDEPFSNECKDRLRVLTVGKPATVKVAYERDIPLGEVSSFIESSCVSCLLQNPLTPPCSFCK
jgi:staphylococcal nuclease domain-containing protein 1